MTRRLIAWGSGLRNTLILMVLLGLGGFPGACQPQTSGPEPLVIRHGGVYTGTYRSDDSEVPCIRVETKEPVILRDCVLTGAGDLILATKGGAQLTVIGCQGYGLPPSADQTRRGHFLEVNSARSLRVEHNYFEQTIGISVYQWSGNGSARQTLTVRFNSAKNIDGRYRDGGGTMVNFLGLNGLPNVGAMEIAWNQVINEPNESLVEDNINFFNSGGTSASPVRLHDNYIQGAYPFPATSTTYTGSGITLDGHGHAAVSATAHINAYNNQIVSTCGAAMNIAAGHDNYFHHNRLVSSSRLPDGTKLTANWTAVAIWNAYKQPPTVFYNNRMDRNVIGFVHWGGTNPLPNRNDLINNTCESCTGTVHLPNLVTRKTEQAEWARWQKKLQAKNVQVGPVTPAEQRSKAVGAAH